jgi:tetratricopeptide (TPR) repeat protein
MREGSNTDRSPGSPHDPLALTLEELIAKRAWRKEPRVSGGPEDRIADARFDPDSAVACPEPDEWTRLAGGEARAADADALMSHAASCRECAVRLRMSLRPLAERASFEESAELAGLASSSPAWQRQRAGELAKSAHLPVRSGPSRLFLWGGIGLASTLIAAAALAVWWQHAHAPEYLLAEAYGHSRIFVLRMPGAPHAEVMREAHLRGGVTNLDPARLLEARARIETLLEVAPHDPHWLQLEARVDVLQEQFNPAIDILDRLVTAGPVTAGLLVDDAAAYFQRGTATGSENDRATALDYLRRADELAPGDPVVLFNEAVVMEDCGQVMNAVETWNRYLRFERDTVWLAEGQDRLRELEQRLYRLKTR